MVVLGCSFSGSARLEGKTFIVWTQRRLDGGGAGTRGCLLGKA
jgi:hypothetical protein